MIRIPICNFQSFEDQFNFGRYRGLSLADVLDINPTYVEWCVKHCTGVIVQLQDRVIEDIKIAYPKFLMDNLFESTREWQLNRPSFSDSDDKYEYEDTDEYERFYEEHHTYDRYSGSWAQDVEGYSDDDIDTILDGDPSAYWNID